VFTGIYAPIYNDYGDPSRLVTLAQTAESAGFDGFFVWDHLAIESEGELELADATVVLAAVAQATSTIKIGPLITPLARRRPWKVAKEIATLDHLSGGRFVFGVGLGEPAEVEFAAFGEDASAKGRAERVDEGLALIERFLHGETVNHVGKHYQVTGTTLLPRPLQQPRPPVWVAASLPHRAGLRRAAKWEGCFPIKIPEVLRANPLAAASWDQFWLTPDEFADARRTIAGMRDSLDDYAMAATGSTADDDRIAAQQKVEAYAAAGANWWLEWIDDSPNTFEQTLELVCRGPPGTP
jgi:alkanesulfonate monooxygenase SsuD/methylene tetrahydromethanopterin reductase-like flavin-dependent oxidoreductase (luciferase family)